MQGPRAVATRRWLKRAVIQGALEAVALAGRGNILPRARGLGAIFTLHHVRPAQEKPFDPAAHLSITPEFLEEAILTLKAAGYRPVALGEIPAHLDHAKGPPVMAFTLDDGYRDNQDFALPVFERHAIPFTIFATGGFIDRTHSIWWKTAEALIGRIDRFDFDFGKGPVSLPTRTLREKYAAFDRLHKALACASQDAIVARLDALAEANGISPLAIVEREVMDEKELRAIAANPLCTLGAHTISHSNLAYSAEERMCREIARSAERLAEITGRRPDSLAYPYGDACSAGPREFAAAGRLGFRLAVTTQPDVLRPRHAGRLHALNRISLNGYYQKPRYVAALASGLPFAIGRPA